MVLRLLLLVTLMIPGFVRAEPITILLTAIGLGSVASYEATGKGLGDHALSGVKGQDCKTARVFGNDPICQDHADDKTDKPKVPDSPVPAPKKIVVVQSSTDSINDFEKLMARRKESQNGTR